MTYSTSNPPRLLGGSLENTAPNLWTYSSADAAATVAGANYFTNGGDLGMKVGDIVFVEDTATPLGTTHRVNTVATGASPRSADVGTGTTVGIATG